MKAKDHIRGMLCAPYARFAILALASSAALLPGSLHGQVTSVRIPSGTPLSVELLQHVPMRAGEQLTGRLLYPVYIENRVALPAGTIVRGSVIQLDSDRSHRIHSRLRGDFTPFHIPVVKFDQVVLPDGDVEGIASDSAKDGVSILRLSPPPNDPKGSFIRRQIAAEKQRVKDTVALFTKPGRGDRLVQFIYTQLPYHPERIDKATSWTVELSQPLELKLNSDPPADTEAAVTPPQDKQNGRKEPERATARSRGRMAATCIPAANDRLCQRKARQYLPSPRRGACFQCEPCPRGSRRFGAGWTNHTGETSAFFRPSGKAALSLPGIEISQRLLAARRRHTCRC